MIHQIRYLCDITGEVIYNKYLYDDEREVIYHKVSGCDIDREVVNYHEDRGTDCSERNVSFIT